MKHASIIFGDKKTMFIWANVQITCACGLVCLQTTLVVVGELQNIWNFTSLDVVLSY